MAIRPQQDVPDRFVECGVAGEPAERVEARRQRHGVVERDSILRGPEADQAAETGRRADGTVGIGSDRDVGEPACDGCRGPGRGAAGDAVRRLRVHRAGEMGVDTDHRVGEFLGLGLADEPGAGIEQLAHCACGSGRRCGLAFPGRIAAAGRITGHVEDVLYGEGRARKWPVFRVRDSNIGIVEKSVERIARGNHRSPLEYTGRQIVRSCDKFNRLAYFCLRAGTNRPIWRLPKVARACGCPPVPRKVGNTVWYPELTPPVVRPANREDEDILKQRRCGPFWCSAGCPKAGVTEEAHLHCRPCGRVSHPILRQTKRALSSGAMFTAAYGKVWHRVSTGWSHVFARMPLSMARLWPRSRPSPRSFGGHGPHGRTRWQRNASPISSPPDVRTARA